MYVSIWHLLNIALNHILNGDFTYKCFYSHTSNIYRAVIAQSGEASHIYIHSSPHHPLAVSFVQTQFTPHTPLAHNRSFYIFGNTQLLHQTLLCTCNLLFCKQSVLLWAVCFGIIIKLKFGYPIQRVRGGALYQRHSRVFFCRKISTNRTFHRRTT